MFIGEYRHSLDNKGRIIVPARFRDELNGSFIITRGLDTCLFGFTMEEWSNQGNKIATLPLTQGDARAFSRLFFSGAAECEMDKQGRVLLPSNLREYAKIDKDVVVIGVSDRFEIWSQEVWDEYSQKTSESYENIAETLVSIN